MKSLSVPIMITCAIAACSCVASAQGFLDLKWNDCSLGTTAAEEQSYSCDEQSGDHFILVASFDPGVNLTGSRAVLADLGYIDLVAFPLDVPDLPQFWKFQPQAFGGCGTDRMLFSADFTSGFYACDDLWLGTANSGAQFGGDAGPIPDGNRARIKWTSNVPTPVEAVFALAGHQYYVERVAFDRSITTCPGRCADEVYIVFTQYLVSLLDSTQLIWYPIPYQHVTWQGANTPTQALTWGHVKALYK